VVGCGTDWQQETRSSVFLIPSKEFAIQLQDAAPALSQRRRTSVIFAACRCTGILFVPDFNGQIPHMHSLTDTFLRIPFRWWIVLISCTVGVAAVGARILQTEESRAMCTERNKKKELRSLAERISVYAHNVHQRYPTGDVVVSERDIAEQLRKRPEAVVTALNLLLNEQKVQKAPLNGYWKLNA